MNVRTYMVPTVPGASTAAVYAAVSLPCEPWNKPNPPKTEPTLAHRIDREDPETKIVRAIRAGNSIFDAIATAAFGHRTGKTDQMARDVMRHMIAKGVLRRDRDLDRMGQPYIWSIPNDK